jgi:hypothetical protein
VQHTVDHIQKQASDNKFQDGQTKISSFEVFAAGQLRIFLYWDMTLHHW